jgi:uncharacterized phage-associated protein
MSWPATKVANYFLKKSFETGNVVTSMKLLKLVYIAHGWHLGYDKGPLVGEAVEAWKYGPVIDSLYQSVRSYRANPITKELDDAVSIDEMGADPSTIQLLDSVWDAYCRHDGLQLSTLTHQQDTPWDRIWHQQGGKYDRGAIIPNDLIERHYKAKIQRAAQQ